MERSLEHDGKSAALCCVAPENVGSEQPPEPWSETAINVASMADGYDQNDEHIVVNLIDDSVVSGPDPIEAVGAGELLATRRARVALEAVEATGDATLDLAR